MPEIAIVNRLRSGAGKATGFLNDLKAFLFRGNVVDLAVALIIGAAFTAIVTSLVNDIIGPLIALASPDGTLSDKFLMLREGKLGNQTYTTVEAAKKDGAVTMNYGNFFQAIINFLIVGSFLFLIIKLMGMLQKKKAAESTDWNCPRCMESVKKGATRCRWCTSEISQPPPSVPAEMAPLIEK